MLRGLSFVIALCFIAIGFTVGPEQMIAMGIMDASLTSEIELTRQTALLEVNVFKWGMMILGYLMAVGTFFWPWLSQTGTVQRFMAHDWSHPAAYEAGLAKKFDVALFVILTMMAMSAVYLMKANDWLTREMMIAINREDGLIEYTSALLLVIAALYAGYVAVRGRAPMGMRLFHAFLALLFIVMCGEEISWGQRILGFETPENLKEVNVQQEVNFHNMFGYVFDHLFILCFFIWGCILPLLYWISPLMRNVLRMIRLPLPSIGLAFAMLLITLYQDEIVWNLVSERLPRLRIPELRELFSAAAFLLMMQQSVNALVPRRERTPSEGVVKPVLKD